MGGPVNADISFSDWLKGQDKKLQDEILGKTRGQLFRDGGLTVDRFTDATGNIYSGLWYPIAIAGMTFVIGLLFVSETRSVVLEDVAVLGLRLARRESRNRRPARAAGFLWGVVRSAGVIDGRGGSRYPPFVAPLRNRAKDDAIRKARAGSPKWVRFRMTG